MQPNYFVYEFISILNTLLASSLMVWWFLQLPCPKVHSRSVASSLVWFALGSDDKHPRRRDNIEVCVTKNARQVCSYGNSQKRESYRYPATCVAGSHHLNVGESWINTRQCSKTVVLLGRQINTFISLGQHATIKQVRQDRSKLPWLQTPS